MASINSGFNGGGGKHTASGFAVTEAGEDDNFTRVKRFKTDDDPLGLAMNNIKWGQLGVLPLTNTVETLYSVILI